MQLGVGLRANGMGLMQPVGVAMVLGGAQTVGVARGCVHAGPTHRRCRQPSIPGAGRSRSATAWLQRWATPPAPGEHGHASSLATYPPQCVPYSPNVP